MREENKNTPPGATPQAVQAPRPDGFRFFTLGGAILTFCAGATNVQTVLGSLHHPATHVTGTLTLLPPALTRWEPEHLAILASLVGGFFLGAAISGAALDSTELRVGRRYGVLLLSAGFMLAMGAFLIGRGALATGGAAVAIAAGLQNAMATRLSAAVVRTTHMTGVLTDLGIALGKALAGRGVTGWRVVIYLSLLGGFAGGSFAGVALHLWLADAGLYVAAALLASLGALYWIWRAGRREP